MQDDVYYFLNKISLLKQDLRMVLDTKKELDEIQIPELSESNRIKKNNYKNSATEKKILSKTELDEEIENLLLQLKDERKYMIKIFREELTNSECQVMADIYINLKNVPQTAKSLGYTERHVFRLRKSAIRKIESKLSKK